MSIIVLIVVFTCGLVGGVGIMALAAMCGRCSLEEELRTEVCRWRTHYYAARSESKAHSARAEAFREKLERMTEHEGMMTRREVLDMLFDYIVGQNCADLDAYDSGFYAGCVRVLGYRSKLVSRAAHELAVLMNAEREE